MIKVEKVTVYFSVVYEEYTYPLIFKRHGVNKQDVIDEILKEFPTAEIKG